MKYLTLVTLLLFAGAVSAQTQYKPDFGPADGSEIHAEVNVTNSAMRGNYQFTVDEQYQATYMGNMHFSRAIATWISPQPSGLTLDPPSPYDNPNYPPPPSGPNNLHHPYQTGAVGGVPQPGTEGAYTFEVEWFWYDTVAVGAGASEASEVRTYTLIIHPSGYTGVRGWGTNGSSSSGGGGGDDDSNGCAGALGKSWALIPVLILLVIAVVFTIASRYIGGQDDGEDDEGSDPIRLREYRPRARAPTQEKEEEREEKAQLQS